MRETAAMTKRDASHRYWELLLDVESQVEGKKGNVKSTGRSRIEVWLFG